MTGFKWTQLSLTKMTGPLQTHKKQNKTDKQTNKQTILCRMEIYEFWEYLFLFSFEYSYIWSMDWDASNIYLKHQHF